MKFRLHPILIPLFLFLFVTGNLSIYTLIFISLLLHELGHLIAARLTGMRVRSCTIMPYGGELVISNKYIATRKNRIILALGGPIATSLLLLIGMTLSFPGDDLLVRIQVTLLALNLLPVLPFDGGQVLSALLEKKGFAEETRAWMLLYSILFFAVAMVYLYFFLPDSLLYLFLALFLFLQNIASFRFRKYEAALIKLKLKGLTK